MINTIIKYKNVFFIVVIILVLLALAKIPSITFNTNFSFFLADNDPEYLFYKNLKSEIKDDESILIIGIKNETSIYEKDFINAVQHFTDSLKQLEEVKTVKGLTNLSYPVKSLFGLISRYLIEITNGSAWHFKQEGKDQ